MLLGTRYVTAVLTLCALLTVYLTLTPVSETHGVAQTEKQVIKNIVAFSLLKQIEIESEEIFCDNFDKGNFSGELSEGGVWFEVPNTNVYVYSVYYDMRLRPHNYLRILAMIRGSWNETLYCQIQTKDGRTRVTKARRNEIWLQEWNRGDNYTYNPVLLSCQVPLSFSPSKLRLNTCPCELSTKSIRILKNRVAEKTNNSVTVCVKPLNFASDISTHLLQWIEMHKLLGAKKIDIYVENIHLKTWRVLKWYTTKNRSFISVKLHRTIKHTKTVKSDDGNSALSRSVVWQKRRNELIPYNDCLYRNLHASHFVLPLDIDEIVVPRRRSSWRQLLNDYFSSSPQLFEEFASFSVRNTYFLENFTSEHPMEPVFFFKYATRSDFSAVGESGKSFISTSNALTVFNHYALDALKPGIRRTYFLPVERVQMNHYKSSCPVELLPECSKYLTSSVRIRDPVILRYRQDFTVNYNKIVKELMDKKLLL